MTANPGLCSGDFPFPCGIGGNGSAGRDRKGRCDEGQSGHHGLLLQIPISAWIE